MAAARSTAGPRAGGAARPRRRALRVRSGDHVKVIAGKDRGKTGRVLRVDPTRERVYVEGLNMVKRHVRPAQTSRAGTERQLGGVIEQEGPLHVSNVMLLDAKGSPTRVGVEREGGRRFRVAKSTGARLD
jgi:large subunit ribosomal protein L24